MYAVSIAKFRCWILTFSKISLAPCRKGIPIRIYIKIFRFLLLNGYGHQKRKLLQLLNTGIENPPMKKTDAYLPSLIIPQYSLFRPNL